MQKIKNKFKSLKQKDKFYILIFIFLVLFFYNIFSTYRYYQLDKYNYIAKINSKYFLLDKAVTSGEQELGLSFRDRMCERCGELFIFEREGIYPFWMKDMRFDLDIIYLDKDKKVIDIFTNVKKENYNDKSPEIIVSNIRTKYVLELNAGSTEKYGIKLGDVLDY